ncbi:MAG: protein kinase [Polyangiaceae bacterium]|nr:protein kinase [Polyangiaceae bacterium]
MSADVDELVRAGRLADAAARAAEAGAHARASELLEQACDYRAAAEAALAAAQPARAVVLAVRAGDAALGERARKTFAVGTSAEQRRSLAGELEGRGELAAAAALYDDAGLPAEAGRVLERGGFALAAAEAWARAGRPAEAARVLEAAVQKAPEAGAPRLALGRLYAAHGRHEHALRALQAIPAGAPERRAALELVRRALEALGLREGLAELDAELARLGGEPAHAASATAHDAPASGRTERAPGSVRPAGEVLYGRYEVVREVATTPHARLLQARDRLTGADVALKIFASSASGAGRDARERFAREARALAALRHPHVVPLVEYVAEGPAMAIAWMAGGSLRALLDREPLTPARAVEIAQALLSALGEAHRRGILHRDLKPSNVLFDAAGSPMLADFGAAHLGGADATATAGEIGTLAYMAPEQRSGRPATVQSDVYGVGALLFEMLTGRLPEAGVGLGPERHPDLDARHEAVLARLLAPAPGDRYEDSERARAALGSLAWPRRLPPGREATAAAAVRLQGDAAPRSARSGRLGAARAPADPCDVGERRHDTTLERDVLVLSLDELACAGAFARAAHPALAGVWRADAAARELWLEAPHGTALASPGAARLEPAEHARLVEALGRLHAAGAVHGAVDADHVRRVAGDVWLAYPSRPGTVEPGADLAALAALA